MICVVSAYVPVISRCNQCILLYHNMEICVSLHFTTWFNYDQKEDFYRKHNERNKERKRVMSISHTNIKWQPHWWVSSPIIYCNTVLNHSLYLNQVFYFSSSRLSNISSNKCVRNIFSIMVYSFFIFNKPQIYFKKLKYTKAPWHTAGCFTPLALLSHTHFWREDGGVAHKTSWGKKKVNKNEGGLIMKPDLFCLF